MDILLINTPAAGSFQHCDTLYIPHGPAMLKTRLATRGHQVRIVDLNARVRSSRGSRKILRSLEKFYVACVKEGEYSSRLYAEHIQLVEQLSDMVGAGYSDMYGFSVNSYAQILAALLICEHIKKGFSGPVVLGGAYVTLYAKEFFGRYRFIDFAVAGDGEIPLCELADRMSTGKDLVDSPSLYYRKDGDVFINHRKTYPAEEQSLPCYDDIGLQDYAYEGAVFLPYTVSVGCPGKCTYCIDGAIEGGWQHKSIRKIINDIRYLKQEYGVRNFKFTDTNFNASYTFTAALCRAMIDNGLDIRWVSRVSLDNMDKELLSLMKKSGCMKLRWGFEVFDNNMLRLLKKERTVANVAEILVTSSFAGIKNEVFIISNYPYETENALEKTLFFLRQNKDSIDDIIIYPFSLYRGSKMYSDPDGCRIRIIPKDASFFTYLYDFVETEKKDSSPVRMKRLRKGILNLKYRHLRTKNFNLARKAIYMILGWRVILFKCFDEHEDAVFIRSGLKHLLHGKDIVSQKIHETRKTVL